MSVAAQSNKTEDFLYNILLIVNPHVEASSKERLLSGKKTS